MKILFVDNDSDFLNTRAAYLKAAGHNVLKASNPAEAEALLRNTHLHLALIDVRLIDDDDQRDTSGLVLAENPEFRMIPKIILTGYPRLEGAQRALVPGPDGIAHTVNYVLKEAGPEAMVDAVETAIATYVRVNPELCLHADAGAGLSLPYLVDQVVNGAEVSTTNALPSLEDQADEMRDLLGSLFIEQTQITLQRRFWRRNGRVALGIIAYGKNGKEQQYIVTLGQRAQIQEEATRYLELSPQAVGSGAQANPQCAETTHFAANAYALVGGRIEDCTTFGAFYRENGARQIQVIIEGLVKTTLAPWHAQQRVIGSNVSLVRLLCDCLSTSATDIVQQLEGQIRALGRETLEQGLGGFDLLDREMRAILPKRSPEVYPNPIACLNEGGPVIDDIAVQYGTTITALTGETILVDGENRTWITDFAELDSGPLLGDYAALETAVKYGLTDLVEWNERLEMEKALFGVSRLNERIDAGAMPQSLEKTVATVRRIRQLAATACGNDIRPYYAVLFAHTARLLLGYEKEVRHTRRELATLLHACLSLGLICQHLPAAGQRETRIVEPGIHIDESDHSVKIDDAFVALTPTEYALLHYLWQHPGQLCSRSALIKAVYGKAGDETDHGRLNMLVTRLRNKIEVDPENPRFLFTRRGEGYLLYPKGK